MSDINNENVNNPYAPNYGLTQHSGGTQPEMSQGSPYAPQQGISQGSPYSPHQGAGQNSPYAPKQGTGQSSPYASQQGVSQGSPYAPQQGVNQGSPYAPQQGVNQGSPYAPQQGVNQGSPYAPQQRVSQNSPYAPQQGAGQGSPYAPQQGAGQGSPYAPGMGPVPGQASKSQPGNTKQPASQPASSPQKKKSKVGLIILCVALGLMIPVAALALYIVFGVFAGFPKGGVSTATSVAYSIVDSINNKDMDSYMELLPEMIKNDPKEQAAVKSLFDSYGSHEGISLQMLSTDSYPISGDELKQIKSNFKKATGKSINSAQAVKYSYELYDDTGNVYIIDDELIVVKMGVKYFLYDDAE